MRIDPPLPAGACDTHMHFYHHSYPSSQAAVLHPPDATVADYRALQTELGTDRVVVVQPTTYGLDNRCQLDAMAELGGAARGIAVIDHTTSADEIDRLDRVGVRGARFHMLPGGAVDWTSLEPVAGAIADVGWHIQLQLNGRELTERVDQLLALPVTVVVDHVGRFMPPVANDHPAFTALCRLIDGGRAWVKISAPYESSVDGPPAYPDIAPLAQTLIERYPERMLWATNWPHPGQADPPTAGDLRALLDAWLPTEHRESILVDNPVTLYGFD
ncbi:MAG: amidohydrolase family protein [Acidimicrobiia bacterium]|nr:amidohydrolase family protein [Acidimicrobiia bacterium]